MPWGKYLETETKESEVKCCIYIDISKLSLLKIFTLNLTAVFIFTPNIKPCSYLHQTLSHVTNACHPQSLPYKCYYNDYSVTSPPLVFNRPIYIMYMIYTKGKWCFEQYTTHPQHFIIIQRTTFTLLSAVLLKILKGLFYEQHWAMFPIECSINPIH